MVLPGVPEEKENQINENSIPTAPLLPSRLHNFNLSDLKWGSQRALRCAKVDDSSTAAFADRPHLSPAPGLQPNPVTSQAEPEKGTIPEDNFGNDVGIEDVRKKLMQDLKTEADRLKDAMLRNEKKAAPSDDTPASPVVAEEERPWKLRKKKAAPEGPPSTNRSPVKSDEDNGSGMEEKKRKKFSIALTKKEIEEDFMEMFGRKPPRRPRKRPRNVQKELDLLFPNLSEVTADKYKVSDDHEH